MTPRRIHLCSSLAFALALLACGTTPDPAPPVVSAIEAPIALEGPPLAPAAPAPPVDEPAAPGDVDLEYTCGSDTDCVLAAYSCCSAPPCDESAFHVRELAALTERCARRVCPPGEARPCGAPPVPPSTIHAACVQGTCAAIP